MKWAGVAMDDGALRDRLTARLHGDVQSIHGVGEIDIGRDAAAIDAVKLAPPNIGAALVVPAWEPPNDGFIDFIKALRKARKDHRAPLAVLLFHQSSPGTFAPPRAQDAALWHARLAQLGDDYLTVAPFAEGGDA
jgi:hypothetical protein